MYELTFPHKPLDSRNSKFYFSLESPLSCVSAAVAQKQPPNTFSWLQMQRQMVSDLCLVLKIWLGWSGSFQSQYFDYQNHRLRYFCPLIKYSTSSTECYRLPAWNMCTQHKCKRMCTATSRKHCMLWLQAWMWHLLYLPICTGGSNNTQVSTLQHLKINYDDRAVSFITWESTTTSVHPWPPCCPYHSGKALDRKPN